MANIVFNFFGTNCSKQLYWSSNNALIFSTQNNPHLESDITHNLVPSILIGNYDRALKSFFYKNTITSNYSITILRVEFYDYFGNIITTPITASTYQYQIRLIKETSGAQRQFVEVYVISSPPSPGYSTGITSYPSGTNIDSNGHTIDSTKNSPYNITNGTAFLNPCGSIYSTVSPAANTSFVFSSDSTGSSWLFTDNSHVNV